MVSIHAPAWGATVLLLMMWSSATSFNPRTRVGCDDNDDVFSLQDGVSIHAPAWGATSQKQANEDSIHGFNPRTRVGCDLSSPAMRDCSSGFNPRTRVGCDLAGFGPVHVRSRFNPRTRVGCDQLSLISGVSDDGVSIHAPAWGATRTARCNRATVMWFQSTHPRGVRPAGHKDCHRSRDGRRKRFNPRTRVGCDGSVPSAVCNTSEFQSTHPRGVRRQGYCAANPATQVSIHAPAWGATGYRCN